MNSSLKPITEVPNDAVSTPKEFIYSSRIDLVFDNLIERINKSKIIIEYKTWYPHMHCNIGTLFYSVSSLPIYRVKKESKSPQSIPTCIHQRYYLRRVVKGRLLILINPR